MRPSPPVADESPTSRRVFTMAALIIAGGVIYAMPYLRQSYHSAMREAMGVSNTELGFLNTAFGVLALLCYLPGGYIADRFSARNLLTVSLLGTGAGGFMLARLPSFGWMLAIHAFWGISTVLTFWAALIRATRTLAGPSGQGRAFGVLDGGRGLMEAVAAAGALLLFGAAANVASGFQAVIILHSSLCWVAAGMVWVLVQAESNPSKGQRLRFKEAFRLPQVRWLSVVVFCGYFAYLGGFDFTGYAADGFGESDYFAASLGTFRLWLRPVAAVVAGVLADRFRASSIVTYAFMMSLSGYLLAVIFPPNALILLWVEISLVGLAGFALRGVYFALLEEGRVPVALTGSAVGLVSVVGYCPDIISPLSLFILDWLPGSDGYRVRFACMAFLCMLGMVAVRALVNSAATPASRSGP